MHNDSFELYNNCIRTPITETLLKKLQNMLNSGNIISNNNESYVFELDLYYVLFSLYYYIYKIELYNTFESHIQYEKTYWQGYLNLPRENSDFEYFQSQDYINKIKHTLNTCEPHKLHARFKPILDNYNINYKTIINSIETHKINYMQQHGNVPQQPWYAYNQLAEV
jgi:hypothetical protein